MFRRVNWKALVIMVVMAMVVYLGGSLVVFGLEFPKISEYQKAKIDWRQAAGETITVAATQMLETDLLKQQLPDFERLTGIKVRLLEYPELEEHQKVQVDLASRAGKIDVFQVDFMFVPQYAEAQYLEPLETYINNPVMTDKDWYNPSDFVPSLWQAAQHKGHVFGLPFTCETTVLFYRKDLLEEAGLAVPTTYEELMNAAKVLTQPGKVYGIALRGMRGSGMNVYIWSPFLLGFGGSWFKDFPNDMTPQLDSPEAIRATEYYAEILRNYGPPGVASWDWLECLSAMQQGAVAMGINAQNEAPELEDPAKSKTAGKWGIALVPKGVDGKRHNPVFSWFFAINAQSKHKVASWLFLQWATSGPASLPRVGVTGGAVRQSAWDNPEFLKEVSHICDGEFATVVRQALAESEADVRPRFPHWRETGDRVGIAVQSVIAGEQNAESAMRKVQQEVLDILKRGGYLK